MNTKSSARKLSISVMLFEFFTIAGCLICLSYINYIYTDVAHISIGAMTLAMSVVNVICFVFSLVSGAIIQKTKNIKMGKYRFFLMLGFLMSIVGGIMMVTTFIDNMTVRIIVISIGYMLAIISLDFTYNSKYVLISKMGNGDSRLIDQLMGMDYGGSNVGYIVYSMLLLTLVAVLGGGSEQQGFFRTSILFGVLIAIGILIILKASKPYDGAETGVEDESANVGIRDMFRSVFTNKLALAVTIGYCVKGIGYSVLNFCLVYQCAYVFGDMNLMTILLVLISVVGAVGGFLAPTIIKKFGGRKRTVMITCAATACLYLLLGFIGKTPLAFSIIVCAAILIQSIADSVEPMMYADAGEFWYHKTGNDTRPFVMGMSAISGKIGALIVTPITAAVLTIAHYSEDALMIGQDATTMTMALGLIPAITLAVFLLILALFHKASDQEIEKCIAENAEKDNALYGDNPSIQ